MDCSDGLRLAKHRRCGRWRLGILSCEEGMLWQRARLTPTSRQVDNVENLRREKAALSPDLGVRSPRQIIYLPA